MPVEISDGLLIDQKCEACGGCGILITAWDTLGDPKDGQVFVDTCDQCTTGGKHNCNRNDASQIIAITLETNILLVLDTGYSFKDAIVATVKEVEALLDLWNNDNIVFADRVNGVWAAHGD